LQKNRETEINEEEEKMMKKRIMAVLALAMMIVVLAVSSLAIAACQAEEATTAQDATISAWGNNFFGQLGSETYNTSSNTPVEVSNLDGAEVKALAGGQGHSLALTEDGTVWAWGLNQYGQLGDGTNTDSSTPVQVKDSTDPTGYLSGVTALAAGSSHSLALKDDGTVWAWGSNTGGQEQKISGQLGNDTITSTNTPVQVSDLDGVKAIAAGSSYSLALKDDGSVWAWGYNEFGQLGDGTNTDSSTPVQVSDLDGVKAISGGGAHSLGLKDDGTVWAWGSNPYGQLGNGTDTLGVNTPVQVSDLSGVTLIAAGDDQSLAA
jgi:alpha-tubulin suppressor-like RCC1 family protein